jgi:hypothetical protein
MMVLTLFLYFYSFILGLYTVNAAKASIQIDTPSVDHDRFEEWKTEHGKTYPTIQEEQERIQIWMQNDGKYNWWNAVKDKAINLSFANGFFWFVLVLGKRTHLATQLANSKTDIHLGSQCIFRHDD